MIETTQTVSYRTGKETVVFVGRRPVKGVSEKTSKSLIAAGVAKIDSEGNLFYPGPIRVSLNDGSKVEFPESGLLDLDPKQIKPGHQFEEAK